MTDFATAEPVAAPSTVLEPETTTSPSGGGTPRTLETEAKSPSLRDTIAAAVKEEDAAPKEAAEPEAKDEKPAKAAEKPETDAKAPDAKDPPKGAERGPDGKFAPKQAEGEPKAETETDAKPAKSGHIEPPSKFLPDAKETWRNTPRPVQRDVENLVREHEAETTRYREASERYEPIRQYDELARQNGRAGAHESLAEVARLETLMQQNPIAAVNQILLQAGPRKADGQPISLFELAQHIVNSGQDGYQRAVTQVPQQQQQGPNPEVEQLKQELASIKQQQLAATIIEPFKAANPRYTELEPDIAFFLQSGKIPQSLSPSDRLAAAYDMAARINPASHDEAPAQRTDPDPGQSADTVFSGGKSIKSAPGAVTADMEPLRGGSIRDLLADEVRRAKRS